MSLHTAKLLRGVVKAVVYGAVGAVLVLEQDAAVVGDEQPLAPGQRRLEAALAERLDHEVLGCAHRSDLQMVVRVRQGHVAVFSLGQEGSALLTRIRPRDRARRQRPGRCPSDRAGGEKHRRAAPESLGVFQPRG